MITKPHPSFSTRMNKFFIYSFSSALVILLDISNLLWKSFLGINKGIGLAAIIIFGFLFYGFWSGARIRCPQCKGKCELDDSERNKSRKAICHSCKVKWDLGISYNMD